MNKICIIGAGGVAKATTLLLSKYYDYDISVISKSIEPLNDIRRAAKEKYNKDIFVHTIDVTNKAQLDELLKYIKPKLVVNLGLPYYNLDVMDACLNNSIHYLDSACYEDINKRGVFSAVPQWNLSDKFKENNLTGVVSCGLTPGFTSVAVNYAENVLNFEQINVVKIYDANAVQIKIINLPLTFHHQLI